jgi:hypothetical protein
MVVIARRFTIVTLSAAVFAITFSAAIQVGRPSGAQSHFGANFTCLQSDVPTCVVVR